MTTSAYATRDEVFTLGLTAQAFATRPRPFDGIDISTGTIRLRAHGFASTDIMTFEVVSGGSLPTGISAFTPYTPVIVSSDLFRVQGFSSFVSGGAGWGVTLDFGRRIDAHIFEVSAEVDQHLTADAPPLI